MAETTDAAPDVIEWPLAEAVCAPIGPENPCGEDPAYDEDYQRMKDTVDALSAATGTDIDFGLLVDLGEKVLTRRAKDLRVAAFLVLGLERTRGPAGLAEGLAAIDALTHRFWEDMHPALKRMAGRQNALQLLSDRLKERVATASYSPDARAHLEDAQTRLKSLQQFTMEAMGERAPALSGLAQAIEEALRKLPAEQVEGVPAEPAPSTSAAMPQGDAPATPAAPADLRAAPAPPPVAPVATDGFRAPRDALRAVDRAVDFLREKDPVDPVPYLIARAERWGPVQEVPPNEGGQTLIPALPATRREALDVIAAGGDHRLLLQVAEEVFGEAPLLLDAQRYVVQAMERLGSEMKPAREAVVTSLAVLLHRVDALPDLTFNDGTPMADGATRAWIESHVRPTFAGSSAGTPASSDGSAVDEGYTSALARLEGGSLQDALRTLQQGADRDRGARDRFRRKLLSARLCMTARQFALARPMLEGLDDEIEQQGLATWEPGLAIEAWKQLHQCLGELARSNASGDGAPLRLAAERIFDKICRIDPTQALDLMPHPKR